MLRIRQFCTFGLLLAASIAAALATSPDYVRYVAAARELWVTEPDSGNARVAHDRARILVVHDAYPAAK